MSTPVNHKRRQPARGAKTQAAREQMSEKSSRLGTIKATPNSHYLAIANRNAEDSPLLRLPPEVRNRIWKILLATEEIWLDDNPTFEIKKPQASILRICRQVHAETCLLLYSVNLFGFIGSARVIQWLKQRLPDQSVAIRRIRVCCCNDFHRPLHSFPNLRTIWVDYICDNSCANDPERRQAVEQEIHKIWGSTDLEVRHKAVGWKRGEEPPSYSRK